MGFNQYTWKYYTGGESSIGRKLPFPFVYNGVEYDLNNLPNDLKINTPDSSNRIGSIYISPIPNTSISLGYSSYASRGYPLLIYGNDDDYNIDYVTISGKYKIPTSINELYTYGSSTIIVNFTVDNVPKRYFVLCGGRDWAGKTTHTPLNYFTAGYGYEYPTLTSSNITKSEDYSIFNKSLTSAEINTNLVGKIIDFGDTPQIVPKYFKDWLDSAFIPIYPYSYTIKNYNGDTVLTSITESPSMINAYLTVVGDRKILTLTGSNNKNYVLEWDSVTPDGTQFLGLATAPNSNRPTLAVGVSTEVSWLGDLVFYESYGKYRPPATTFDINLYQNSAEVNRVDKGNYLVGVGTLSGALREECSMLTPSIVYQSSDVPTFNYVYIPIFNRYYYVTSLSSVSKNVWRMELNCDVLMTYKEQIFLLQGVIGRQEIDFNPLLVDNELPTQNNPIVEVIDIPSDAFNTQTSDAGHNYVITVIGA